MTSKKLVKSGVGELKNKNSQQYTKPNEKNNLELNGTNSPIEGTPFRTVKTENGYMLAMGNIAIKEFETKQQAKNAVYRKDWDILLIATAVHTEMVKKEESTDNKEVG